MAFYVRAPFVLGLEFHIDTARPVGTSNVVLDKFTYTDYGTVLAPFLGDPVSALSSGLFWTDNVNCVET